MGKIINNLKKQGFILIFRHYREFWIIFSFLLLINCLYYIIPLKNKEKQIKQIQNELMETRKKNLEPVKTNDDVKNYISAKQGVQIFRKILPEEKSIMSIARQINDLINKNQLSGGPVKLNPQGIIDLFLLKYKAELKLTGSYSDLKQFLAEIQNLSNLFCIENLSLTNTSSIRINKNNEEITLVDMELNIITYFRGSMAIQGMAQ